MHTYIHAHIHTMACSVAKYSEVFVFVIFASRILQKAFMEVLSDPIIGYGGRHHAVKQSTCVLLGRGADNENIEGTCGSLMH